jgi:hypothetical protein
MTLSLSIFAALAALVACSTPPPDPGASPEGRLCGRAYGSTIDSLEDMYTQAGQDLPEVLSKKDYVKMCVEMGFTEAQLKCMDPKLAAGNDACKEAMESVKDKTAKLAEALLLKKNDAGAGGDKMKEEPEGGEGDE